MEVRGTAEARERGGRMTAYRIQAVGCDDMTQVTIDLSPQEFAAVQKVADAINAERTTGCMPSLTVNEVVA